MHFLHYSLVKDLVLRTLSGSPTVLKLECFLKVAFITVQVHLWSQDTRTLTTNDTTHLKIKGPKMAANGIPECTADQTNSKSLQLLNHQPFRNVCSHKYLMHLHWSATLAGRGLFSTSHQTPQHTACPHSHFTHHSWCTLAIYLDEKTTTLYHIFLDDKNTISHHCTKLQIFNL